MPQRTPEVGAVAVSGRRAARSSEIVAVADAVIHEHQAHCAGSLVLTIAHSRVVGALMAVVDTECTAVFGDVHPVVILNFGRYQSVISFEMFGID